MGGGNNAKASSWQCLNKHGQFVIDENIPAKLQFTFAQMVFKSGSSNYANISRVGGVVWGFAKS